jgi:cytochrome c2
MTKPQIWVAAFLALFILLFLLARLTKEEDTSTEMPVENPVPQTNMSSENLSGADLVNRLGCVTCHGRDLKGTTMGPDLYGVSQYWSRDKLINYLRNPQSFMDNDRFKEYKEKYQTIMPPFNQVDVKDLGKIAEYILSLK